MFIFTLLKVILDAIDFVFYWEQSICIRQNVIDSAKKIN